MKITIFISFVLTLSLNLRGQSLKIYEIYDTFRGEEGVLTLYIPGFACQLAAGIADLETAERELLHSIKSLRIQVIENPDINRKVNFARLIDQEHLDKDYLTLLSVRDGKEDVVILAREKKERIAELIILVGGNENVMVWIKGRMDRDLMKSLYGVTGIESARYTKEI